jgi:hypothetical protein
MIKHIVLWKLKEGALGRSRKENASELKKLLEGLKRHIPEILELEVGLPLEEGNAVSDAALYSIFKDQAALEIYQKHPEHQKVAAFVKQIVDERRVVDYQI